MTNEEPTMHLQWADVFKGTFGKRVLQQKWEITTQVRVDSVEEAEYKEKDGSLWKEVFTYEWREIPLAQHAVVTQV